MRAIEPRDFGMMDLHEPHIGHAAISPANFSRGHALFGFDFAIGDGSMHHERPVLLLRRNPQRPLLQAEIHLAAMLARPPVRKLPARCMGEPGCRYGRQFDSVLDFMHRLAARDFLRRRDYRIPVPHDAIPARMPARIADRDALRWVRIVGRLRMARRENFITPAPPLFPPRQDVITLNATARTLAPYPFSALTASSNPMP